jgi:DNA polymerase-3 subunit gamma/tau
MSYLVLARKWRPQGFEDLIGQGPIVRILTNSIEQDKIAHAYIFSGPRGVGKTSTARILAKALNCEKGPTPTPCGQCTSCKAVTESQSIDVHEIDGASNTGVDNIRDLRERVKYAPSGGRYKVYIIDEAHMLSQGAFNALLKTLEEPPPHVIFVLATTEPRKIPLTVMSRCQHLPFKRISTDEIRQRLLKITDSEGISIAQSALYMIARAADGSIRDSLTILDQVASFSTEIRDDDVKDLLGITDFKGLRDITIALLEGKREEILDTVSELNEKGTDLRAFTRDLIKFFRDLLVAKLSKGPEGVLDASADEMGDISKLASKVSLEYLSLIIPELIKAESDVRTSFSPRIALEMSLIRTSYLSMYRPVSDAIAALSTGEKPVPSTNRTVKETPLGPKTNNPPHATETSKDKEHGGEPPASAPTDAKDLLDKIMGRIDDPKLTSKLAHAKPELNDGSLILNFDNSDAEFCAEPIRDCLDKISKVASEVRRAPTSIEIKIKAARKRRTKKDFKEKAMSEPLVKEALELFEGRVVDVKEVKD